MIEIKGVTYNIFGDIWQCCDILIKWVKWFTQWTLFITGQQQDTFYNGKMKTVFVSHLLYFLEDTPFILLTFLIHTHA